MNQEKKVFLLILSLIVLIILCVYTHLEKITSSQSIAVAKPEATEEKVELKEKQEEERVLPSTKPVSLETNKEESSSEEQVSTQTSTEENASEKTSQNEIQTEVSTLESSKEELNKEKDIHQEETQNIVEEVQEEALLTTDTRYIRESDEKRIEELSKDTQLLQIKINDYIKNNPIIFRKGTKITNSSIKSIKTISEFLKESPNIRIEIAGHTDAVGTKRLNQAISLERAKSIKKRLIKDGIDENRMIVRGYGEDIPLVKNSPKGYSKINRRVEFNIVEE